MVYESFSAADTMQIARSIAGQAKPGEIYALTGDLGTGKTIFAKGFAAGLGIDSSVTSPTFAILNEYHDGRLPLYHFDVYRIKSIFEMEDTGYDEYFYGNGVCLVEWAELIADLIPEGSVWISVNKDLSKHEDYRQIKITAE